MLDIGPLALGELDLAPLRRESVRDDMGVVTPTCGWRVRHRTHVPIVSGRNPVARMAARRGARGAGAAGWLGSCGYFAGAARLGPKPNSDTSGAAALACLEHHQDMGSQAGQSGDRRPRSDPRARDAHLDRRLKRGGQDHPAARARRLDRPRQGSRPHARSAPRAPAGAPTSSACRSSPPPALVSMRASPCAGSSTTRHASTSYPASSDPRWSRSRSSASR